MCMRICVYGGCVCVWSSIYLVRTAWVSVPVYQYGECLCVCVCVCVSGAVIRWNDTVVVQCVCVCECVQCKPGVSVIPSATQLSFCHWHCLVDCVCVCECVFVVDCQSSLLIHTN